MVVKCLKSQRLFHLHSLEIRVASQVTQFALRGPKRRGKELSQVKSVQWTLIRC